MKLFAAAIAASALLFASSALTQAAAPQPLVIQLIPAQGSRSLLHGAPQTAGVRSGFVSLESGESVGWHTTGQHEETLVILRGQGAALVDGQPERDFAAPAVIYIPPATRHNIRDTGRHPLKYVYVVAPVPAAAAH